MVNPPPPPQGLLVKASAHGSTTGYSYNTVTVVLLTEVAKMILSCAIYLREHSTQDLGEQLTK